jgi:hypothetical protein
MSDEQPSSSAQSPIRFATEILPLFRESDRTAMLRMFDLWSHDDVVAHGAAIAASLSKGTMPCDGPWPSEQVSLFDRWLAEGGAL